MASEADVASARCAGSGGDKAAVDEGALGRRPLQESRGKDDRKERDAPHTEQASSASEKPLCWGSGPGFSPRDDATLRNKVCARENYSQTMQMATRPKELRSKHNGAPPRPGKPILPLCPPEPPISHCCPSPSATAVSGRTQDLTIRRKSKKGF